jgi:hypothetical protein
MYEFVNHNRPEFVSSSEDGSQCVLIRESATTYYRPAGHWSLSDGLVEGKHVIRKSEAWQLDPVVGKQLYPSTLEQYLEDNGEYVNRWRGCMPWDPSHDIKKPKSDDDIPF